MGSRDFASLRADIGRELAALDRVEGQGKQLLARVPDQPTFVEIRTAGSLLHDFYTGIEKIFGFLRSLNTAWRTIYSRTSVPVPLDSGGRR